MVGEGWTNKSPAVRLSFASPMLLLLVGPVWRRSVGHGLGLGAAFGFALLVIAWTAYVAWRVTMNAHRRGGLYDEAR
jgi:hypothetical protein